MVLFNLALWAFIFFSDDAPIREINAKRNQLFERSNLFVKMVEPIFEATDLSPFARQLAIEKVFRDKRIVGSENLILKKFVAEPYEGEAMTYFNGNKYEGTFTNNTIHGYGTMTYVDGTVDEGEWESGIFVGDPGHH